MQPMTARAYTKEIVNCIEERHKSEIILKSYNPANPDSDNSKPIFSRFVVNKIYGLYKESTDKKKSKNLNNE